MPSFAGGVNRPAAARRSAAAPAARPASVVQDDLAAIGNAPGFAVRASRHLSQHLVVNTRGLVAWPDQRSNRSTLFVPEAQLQYRWTIARFSPYVGGGGGLAMRQSPIRTNWESTLSVAGGTGIRLTDRIGLLGELRLRGINNFAASTAEWSVGMTWRLPAF